jgi:predicted phage baseplate assembly protein
VFGGAGYGFAPHPGSNNVRATYRLGGGAVGNVAAQAITEIAPVTKAQVPLADSCFNPLPAGGGEEAESVEHAVAFGPLAFRAGRRAVTLSDFVSIAHQVGGVAKVRARSRGWNQIDLFVAPSGTGCAPAPVELKQRLLAFFEDKRMVGTSVRVLDPTCVPIDVALSILVEHNFSPESVRAAVDRAVRDLFAFERVHFGRPLYLSKVYEAVEAVPGVQAATVTRFARSGRAEPDADAILRGEPRASAGRPVSAPGRLAIGEFELPFLARFSLAVEERWA